MGFLPLCDLANSSPDKKEKRMAKGIISKNLALGLSPALAILIIPLATRVGKKTQPKAFSLELFCVWAIFQQVQLPKISYLIHLILTFLGGCLTCFV